MDYVSIVKFLTKITNTASDWISSRTRRTWDLRVLQDVCTHLMESSSLCTLYDDHGTPLTVLTQFVVRIVTEHQRNETRNEWNRVISVETSFLAV